MPISEAIGAYSLTVGLLSFVGAPSAPGTVLFYGQSNMNSFLGGGTGSGTGAPPDALEGTSYFDDTSQTWGPVPTADGLRILLNSLVTLTGRPWRGINGALNGTDTLFLASVDPINPDGGGGLFRFLNILSGAGVTSADLIFWRQGESDAGVAPAKREDEYLASLSSIHQTLCDAMGKTKAQMPFIVSSLATFTDRPDDEVLTALTWSNVQRYLFEVDAKLPNMYFSHNNNDAVMNADTLHELAAANVQSGFRYAQTTKYVLGRGGGPAHFEIAHASTVDARTTLVTINHSDGATDWSGSTGFEVSGDNGATWLVPTVSRVDASSFNLVTSEDVSTTNARVLRYQWGNAPDISDLIIDNSPLALPLTYTARDIRPASLSNVPVPLYWENAYDNNQAGITQVAENIPIGPAAAQRLVILGMGSPAIQCTVTIAPNVGTAKTATVIQTSDNPSANEARLAYAVLDSDADAATTVTVTLVYDDTPFGQTQMDIWTIPSADLNSTTPAAVTQLAAQPASDTQTINVATSEGGFTIAYAYNDDRSLLGSFSGTENFAIRYTPNGFNRTIAADSANNAANASSAITATYPAATGKISMIAACWR